MDVAEPGSLTKNERLLAISGTDELIGQEVTPMLPSDMAACAASITISEAYVIRRWLIAASNTDVLVLDPGTTLLDDVILATVDMRLTSGSLRSDTAIGPEILEDLTREADEMYDKYLGGRIPGQLELEMAEGSADQHLRGGTDD